MSVWVVAADSARARLFRAEARSKTMVEIEDLLHPASRAREQALVSDRAGRDASPGGGVGHSMGHEHEAEREELERFARELGRKLCAARREGRFTRLHVLAAPRFLGALRKQLDGETRAVLVTQLDANVTAEDAAAIRARLPARL